MAYSLFSTAFGVCGLAWNNRGLAAFALPDHEANVIRQQLSALTSPEIAEAESPEWIQELVGQVRAHLTGQLQEYFDTSHLDWSLVTPFQRAVYEHTRTIKPGWHKSYGEIASNLGQPPGASRAVGAALGANPWPLLVPCHRVVAANGHMTGFSGTGGIETKLKLLTLEGNQLF